MSRNVMELKDRRYVDRNGATVVYRREYVIPMGSTATALGFDEGNEHPDISGAMIQRIGYGGTYRKGTGKIMVVTAATLEAFA